jgi:hypothetical protein
MDLWEKHYETAEDNKEFANFIYQRSNRDYYGWVTVILFYSAYHYLCAFLLKNGHCKVAPAQHKGRKSRKTGRWIMGAHDYAEKYFPSNEKDKYMKLFEYGHTARYTPKHEKYTDSVTTECMNGLNKIALWVKQEIY